MKKTTIILVILIVFVLIVGIYFVVKGRRNNDEQLLASVQNSTIFFYGDGCPHCANVDKFVTDNNVESKIQFERKEIFNDSNNSHLMTLIATKKCGLSESNLGVPFLWDGPESKCVSGDQPIIDFFKQKLGI